MGWNVRTAQTQEIVAQCRYFKGNLGKTPVWKNRKFGDRCAIISGFRNVLPYFFLRYLTRAMKKMDGQAIAAMADMADETDFVLAARMAAVSLVMRGKDEQLRELFEFEGKFTGNTSERHLNGEINEAAYLVFFRLAVRAAKTKDAELSKVWVAKAKEISKRGFGLEDGRRRVLLEVLVDEDIAMLDRIAMARKIVYYFGMIREDVVAAVVATIREELSPSVHSKAGELNAYALALLEGFNGYLKHGVKKGEVIQKIMGMAGGKGKTEKENLLNEIIGSFG